MRLRLAVLGIVLAAATSLAAQDAPRWPDTFTARVEALALMQTLSADVLASRSATATLETWCGDHHLADPARIVADRVQQAGITLRRRKYFASPAK